MTVSTLWLVSNYTLVLLRHIAKQHSNKLQQTLVTVSRGYRQTSASSLTNIELVVRGEGQLKVLHVLCLPVDDKPPLKLPRGEPEGEVRLSVQLELHVSSGSGRGRGEERRAGGKEGKGMEGKTEQCQTQDYDKIAFLKANSEGVG